MHTNMKRGKEIHLWPRGRRPINHKNWFIKKICSPDRSVLGGSPAYTVCSLTT